jgi:uncharacterized protein (TIGR00369 family)
MMANFRILNEDFAATLRAYLASLPFARYLGVEIAELGAGAAAVRIAKRPELTQGDGFFQAGVVGSAADFAGALAAATLLPPGWVLATLDYTVKLVAPTVGEGLVARGEVVRAGHVVTVSRADVFGVVNGREQLSAVAMVTTRSLELPRSARRAPVPSSSAAPVGAEP